MTRVKWTVHGGISKDKHYAGEVVQWCVDSNEATALIRCDDGMFRFADVADIRAESAPDDAPTQSTDHYLLVECKLMLDDMEHEAGGMRRPNLAEFYRESASSLHTRITDFLSAPDIGG